MPIPTDTHKRSLLTLSALRKSREEDTDLWPISLADMMTLLLCFFMLIVAVSHVDMTRYETIADSMQKAMAVEGKPARERRLAQAPEKPREQAPPPAPAPAEPPAVRSKVSGTTLAREPAPATPEEPAKPAEATAPSPPEPKKKTLEDIKKELQERLVKAKGAVDITPQENAVALNLRGAAFFDLASAELKPESLPLLKDIAASLAGTPYRVSVEGHTDNLPIESWLYPSNWELSSARASRVARYLIDQGVARDRMRVEGLADTKPVAPNTDEAGHSIPENQAKNRRVVILVSP